MELTKKLEKQLKEAVDSKIKMKVLDNAGKITEYQITDFNQAGFYFTGYLPAYDAVDAKPYLFDPVLDEAFEGFGGEKPGPSSTFILWHAVAGISFLQDSPVSGLTNNKQGERMGLPEPQPTTIRVFISHSSQDVKVATALVNVLEVALSLDSKHIRATSVPGHKLSTGAHTSSQLREEISNAKVIIGIITANSMASSYVLFELGASWGLGIPTFPLLACGADFSILPGPLKERHASSLNSREDIQQVIDDIDRNTDIKRQSGVGAKLEVEIDTLLNSARRA